MQQLSEAVKGKHQGKYQLKIYIELGKQFHIQQTKLSDLRNLGLKPKYIQTSILKLGTPFTIN